MAKILGSWSGMRKYLEDEILAESLKYRIQYSCTTYPNMDDCKIFEIRVDGRTQKQFSMETVAFRNCHSKGSIDRSAIWSEYWKEKDSLSIEDKTEFDDEEFCSALATYRSVAIGESIVSNNPLVRMFAVLDRRIGKRTLEKLKRIVETPPEWLKYFYELRLNAENIT